MPFGIIGSLIACTVIYILVSIVLTLIVNYKSLNVPDPVAVAVDAFGPQWAWFAKTIKVGAIIGLTSVILVLMYGQTRIFYTMARDGLLPKVFCARSPEVPHAVDQHPGRRPRRRLRRRLLRHQLPRRRDLGRHARRVRDRLPDGDLAAPHPPGYSARLSRAALSGRCRRSASSRCFALIFTVETRVLIFFGWYIVGAIVLYFVYGMHNCELAKGRPGARRRRAGLFPRRRAQGRERQAEHPALGQQVSGERPEVRLGARAIMLDHFGGADRAEPQRLLEA